jgi:hypothetical protein
MLYYNLKLVSFNFFYSHVCQFWYSLNYAFTQAAMCAVMTALERHALTTVYNLFALSSLIM